MSIQQPDANELTPDEEPQVLSKYEVIRREIAEKMNNHDFELELLSAVNGLDKGLTKSSEFKQQYEREIRELFERMVNEVIPLARELHSRTGKFLKIIRETYANTQLIKEVSDKLEAKMATSVMTDAEISKFLTSSFGFNFEASDESSITWGQGFLEDGEHKYLRIKSLITKLIMDIGSIHGHLKYSKLLDINSIEDLQVYLSNQNLYGASDITSLARRVSRGDIDPLAQFLFNSDLSVLEIES